MPFRLYNIPVIYIRLINNILRRFLDISYICYLNNILVYLKIEKDYIKYMIEILEALKRARLLLKLEKYKFYIKETEFLRFIII